MAQYHGTIPGIAQAYQNDPRNRLAQSQILAGTAMTPVAAGGYGIPDGLARAAQAIMGAVSMRNQDRRYARREDAYTEALRAAAALAQQPQAGQTPQPANPAVVNPAALNPATVNPSTPPPMAAAAQALAGPQPGTVMPVNIPPSQVAQQEPMPAMVPPQPPMPPQPPQMAEAPLPPIPPQIGAPQGPTAGGTGPSRGAPDILSAMVPITLHSESRGRDYNRRGGVLTSSAGARGRMQVMPGTQTDPGYGVRPAQNESMDELARVGRDYLGAMMRRYDGNPAMAWAAYNAGPRRMDRALRRGGENWLGRLPPETQRYVQANMEMLDTVHPHPGNPGNQLDHMVLGTNGQPVDPNAINTAGTDTSHIIAPQMEQIPQAPPQPVEAPTAPALPAEVQSGRLRMANRLLESGNPDLVAIAEQYLNTGLDEQNRARILLAEQQFQQGQTGYQSALNDYTGARSDFRQDAYGQRRDAQNRNFNRESDYADRRFQSGERVQGQGWQSGESRLDRAWRNADREDTQTWQSRENQLDRDAQQNVADTRARRNAYFNSPTGLRMQAENGERINQNNSAIEQYQRFLDLSERQPTGGVYGVPGVAPLTGITNPDIREMSSIANNTTLANLGGGLGAQISDSDRRFISEANVSVAAPRTANQNIARARIGALRRTNDYLTEFANAQADDRAAEFTQEWTAFINSAPIVQYDRNGNARATDQPMTFRQWRESRPRYDAQGRRR